MDKTTHKENQSLKLTQKKPLKKAFLSLHPLGQHKRISRLLAPRPPAAAVQGFPPYWRGSISSSSSPTAVPTKAQRLNAKKIIINVVCQDMNHLLPQFRDVSSSIAFKIQCLQINTMSKKRLFYKSRVL